MKTKAIPDTEKDPIKQNELLREHLDGPWIDYDIVRIERMEKQKPPGPKSGWRVYYN